MIILIYFYNLLWNFTHSKLLLKLMQPYCNPLPNTQLRSSLYLLKKIITIHSRRSWEKLTYIAYNTAWYCAYWHALKYLLWYIQVSNATDIAQLSARPTFCDFQSIISIEKNLRWRHSQFRTSQLRKQSTCNRQHAIV